MSDETIAQNPDDILKELEADPLADLGISEDLAAPMDDATKLSLEELEAKILKGETATASPAKAAPSKGPKADLKKAKAAPKKSRFAFLDRFKKKKKKKKGKAKSVKKKREAGWWKKLPIVLMVKSVISSDGPTQKMAILFFCSWIAAAYVVKLGWNRLELYRFGTLEERTLFAKELAEAEARYLETRADISSRKGSTVELGAFTFRVRPDPRVRMISGVDNQGEIEVALLCDNPETQAWIKDHKDPIRDIITEGLDGWDRDEVLSIEGKRRLKRLILQRLNEWLPRGKVREVYFSKLVIS